MSTSRLIVERPEPLAVRVKTDESSLTVELSDGRVISVPLVWFPRLYGASAEDRSEYELLGRGIGIHWPRIDEDLSVAGLLQGNH